MNNFEKIKAMDEKGAWETFCEWYHNAFCEYIDYEAFLKSSSKDPLDFLVYDNIATVIPSEYDMVTAQREHEAAGMDFDKNAFIKKNTRKMPILDKKSLFSADYYVLADLSDWKIIKVPSNMIVEIKEKGS